MAAAMLDQELKFARTGGFANRSANTTLYFGQKIYEVQNADAVGACSGAAALARELVT